MNRYLKAVLAAAIPLAAAINSWITTGNLNANEIALGLTGVVAAILVYFFRNQGTGFLSATKFIVAAATPIVSAIIQAAVPGTGSAAAFSTLLLGFVTAVLVYFVGNEGPNGGRPPGGSRVN